MGFFDLFYRVFLITKTSKNAPKIGFYDQKYGIVSVKSVLFFAYIIVYFGVKKSIFDTDVIVYFWSKKTVKMVIFAQNRIENRHRISSKIGSII